VTSTYSGDPSRLPQAILPPNQALLHPTTHIKGEENENEVGSVREKAGEKLDAQAEFGIGVERAQQPNPLRNLYL
jgi:hypothetical protein